MPRGDYTGRNREFIIKIVIFQKKVPEILINNQKILRKNLAPVVFHLKVNQFQA